MAGPMFPNLESRFTFTVRDIVTKVYMGTCVAHQRIGIFGDIFTSRSMIDHFIAIELQCF